MINDSCGFDRRYMRRKYKSVKRTEMDLKKTSVALNLLPYGECCTVTK